MSVPLEQDYVVGLPELPSMETTEKTPQKTTKTSGSFLNLKATELRLGLPGSESPEKDEDGGVCSGKLNLSGNGGSEMGIGKDGNLFTPPRKREQASVMKESTKPLSQNHKPQISSATAAKEQVVGWPPIRSFRKNSMATSLMNDEVDASEANSGNCLYVKVSKDGAPFLRKVDLKNFDSYRDLSSALNNMFTCFTISQCGTHGVSSRDKLSESKLMDLLHGSEYVLTYEDKDGDWMLVGDVPWEMFTNSCKRLRIMKSSEAIGLAPRAMEKCKSRNKLAQYI
ncbi:hypothetical protein HN51_008628 [Arachis hypogaea]|uniref:Auxin-induced protein n=1 Tax=Arachis hypogaea TaxID=3818 RepID=A0A445D2M3_ARAHY|nr:Auxin-responsive protein [Arachis hypogaea]RYR57479.1 hypothetical protein Ahy_A05g023212 [Arachis hypogaea]